MKLSNDDDCSWHNPCQSFSSWCWSCEQAIATAKGWCNSIYTDVRMASKEQVESLGGKFLTVEGSENLKLRVDTLKRHQIIQKTRRTIIRNFKENRYNRCTQFWKEILKLLKKKCFKIYKKVQ